MQKIDQVRIIVESSLNSCCLRCSTYCPTNARVRPTALDVGPATDRSPQLLALARLDSFGQMRVLGVVRRGFPRRRDVLSSGAFQDFFRSFLPVRVVTVNRDQNSAVLHTTLVPLGFVFWNSHSDQSSRDSADCPTHARSS